MRHGSRQSRGRQGWKDVTPLPAQSAVRVAAASGVQLSGERWGVGGKVHAKGWDTDCHGFKRITTDQIVNRVLIRGLFCYVGTPGTHVPGSGFCCLIGVA